MLEFAWIFFVAQSCIFLEFLWWGVSVHLAWTKLICFTCYFCLFPEISCFCYLCYIFDLTWIPTYITFGWPHVMDTPRNLRNQSVNFCWKNLCCWAICLLSFGTRTVFLPTLTNYSQLYLTEVRTSGTVSEFSCGIVVSSEECSTEVD